MQVSSIAIKTGTVQNAESDCRAVMEICDQDGHCCETTPNGKGLDHPGKDRRSGQTDIYTSTAVLGNCAEVIREACRICFWFKGQTASPKRMKLRKSSKLPLTPPLIFGKSYCGFRDKSAYVHYGGTVVYYMILF